MTWDEIAAFLLELPETEPSVSWGMPGIKTNRTLVAWWRDQPDSPGALAIKVPREELEAVLADDGNPFYTIEHFRTFNSNAVLARPEDVDPDELREMLIEAWRSTAKVRTRKAWDADHEVDQ